MLNLLLCLMLLFVLSCCCCSQLFKFRSSSNFSDQISTLWEMGFFTTDQICVQSAADQNQVSTQIMCRSQTASVNQSLVDCLSEFLKSQNRSYVDQSLQTSKLDHAWSNSVQNSFCFADDQTQKLMIKHSLCVPFRSRPDSADLKESRVNRFWRSKLQSSICRSKRQNQNFMCLIWFTDVLNLIADHAQTDVLNLLLNLEQLQIRHLDISCWLLKAGQK